MWITLLGSIVGSAWSGSPCLRMQAAHSFSNWVGLPVDGRVVEPPSLALPLLLPLGFASLATVGELVPTPAVGAPEPPHAASPTAVAATRTAS
jgi:hypothetical protein